MSAKPQAVADLLVEVLRVWRTRDKMKLTDAQISERAANGALALISTFDVRHRDEGLRWTAVAMGEEPDPRIPYQSPDFGKRKVAVTLLVDSDGVLWEMVGRDEPTRIGRPPVPANTTKGETP